MAPPEHWSIPYRIADFEFSLEGTDPDLRHLAEGVYSASRVADRNPRTAFRLTRSEDHFLVLYNNEEICRQAAIPEFFQDVEWVVTAEAMARLGENFLQLHGGAVRTAAGDGAVLFVGGHGAGKTTLTVALAQRGAAVLTDEVALVDPHTLEMTPFRRDLILHTGTQRLFPDVMRDADAQTFKIFEE